MNSSERRETRRTFCRICPAGCGLTVEIRGEQILRVRGDKSNPLSRGYACPKGQAAGLAHHNPRRLDLPLLRQGGQLRASTWPTALEGIGTALRNIRATAGPDAIGFYFGTAAFFDTGAQVARRFAAELATRSWYTSTSVDAPGWMLVAERITGNPWLWPQPDRDAELVVLVGSNPAVSHGHNFYVSAPVTWLKAWSSRRGLWVIDPRRTETAALASEHMRPRPGTEYLLFAYLIRSLLEEGGADSRFLADHCRNVDALADAVRTVSLDDASHGMGVPPEQILRLLSQIRDSGRIAVHPGTGVSMSLNANVATWLIWALHGVTGSLDRPGGVWFNRGMMRDLDSMEASAIDTTGPGPKSRPDLPSRCGELPSAAIPDEIEAGNLRALIVIGGNPVIALPDTQRVQAALQRLELLVVMDVVPTGTTKIASHVLPCSGQFERADLSLSEIVYPEEYTQYTPAIVPLSGERRPAWWILGQIANRLGLDIAPSSMTAEAEQEVLKLAVQMPRFDVAKLCGGSAKGILVPKRTWNWVDRHLKGGRWDLAPEDLVAQLMRTTVRKRPFDAFVLIPSRQRYKLNSTMNDGVADRHSRDCAGLFIHPDDAEAIGLRSAQVARITSASGSLLARARLDIGMMRGCISIPHGFEATNVGNLTSSRIHADPLSGMVQLTGIEVLITPLAD